MDGARGAYAVPEARAFFVEIAETSPRPQEGLEGSGSQQIVQGKLSAPVAPGQQPIQIQAHIPPVGEGDGLDQGQFHEGGAFVLQFLIEGVNRSGSQAEAVWRKGAGHRIGLVIEVQVLRHYRGSRQAERGQHSEHAHLHENSLSLISDFTQKYNPARPKPHLPAWSGWAADSAYESNDG